MAGSPSPARESRALPDTFFELGREPIRVALYCLIQSSGLYAVEISQIAIEQDSFSAQRKDLLRDALNRNYLFAHDLRGLR